MNGRLEIINDQMGRSCQWKTAIDARYGIQVGRAFGVVLAGPGGTFPPMVYECASLLRAVERAAYEPATIDEVADCLGDPIEVVGDHDLRLASNPDVILWSSMSLQLVQLVDKLIGDNRISLQCCDPLLYQLNGHVVQMPVIQYVPVGRLVEPSWLPCVLTTKDHDSDSTAFVTAAEWN